MESLKISIIVGSTRQHRFSEKPAQWIYEEAKKLAGVEPELLDLRDYPLPFFDEIMGPSSLNGNYSSDGAKEWAKKVAEADAFVVVTPEYNHGYPGVLKNAFDYAYNEWNNKPVAFVSYGGVGGARSVEQLRQVVIELQMAPIRNAVHIPGAKLFPILMGKAEWKPREDAALQDDAKKMLTQLLWWGHALKAARG